MSAILAKYPNWIQLPFEERQRLWRGEQRQFRQHHGRADRPNTWEIKVDGDRVHTRYGLLGGAMQETDYVGKVKNAGRSNAITSEQDAIAEARRDARKKWDFEGYDEYVGDTNVDHRFQDIDIQSLLTNLPGSFCLYKPENNLMDQKKLLEKAEKGDPSVLYTLKRDGVAKWIVIDYYGNIQIYSRRSRAWQDTEGPTELSDGTLDYSSVVPWAKRFPHLIQAVRDLGLPNGSMMAVELIAEDRDDFPYISGLTKGYTERAIQDMQQHGFPKIYWWDLPFYGGHDLVRTSEVMHRYGHIQHYWSIAANKEYVSRYIQPIQFSRFKNPDEAVAHAKSMKFEGYVVVDSKAIYGDKGWNLKGKPDRPSTCAKLKPLFEDDFVVMWDPDNGVGEWGTGKHEVGKEVILSKGGKTKHGGVGSMGLFQYNDKGELVFICKCSGGIEYEYQAQLRKENFPMVWQVEYPERTYISDGDKTNALRHPRFVRARNDKAQNECINPRL
jgi:hypothetical protein